MSLFSSYVTTAGHLSRKYVRGMAVSERHGLHALTPPGNNTQIPLFEDSTQGPRKE
jgi:hypothetical protein